MKVTFIYHSCFLLETDRFYYLFDYEKGALPQMDIEKPILVLSSHSHSDHYNPAIFSLLAEAGMKQIRAILSEDITPPAGIDTLQVAPETAYELDDGLTLFTLRSTDLGVAFLLQEGETLLYHAGDLNDWIWDEESEDYNRQMTSDYRKQIDLLAEKVGQRELDAAFVVLDPRQEKDYDRGLCYFLENVPVKKIYPMHDWETPSIIDTFLKEHPNDKVQCAEKR